MCLDPSGGPGTNRPTWGCIYHHYVNVKGLAAPFTGKQLALQSPEIGGQGCCSGGYDQLGFESLTCALDPISSGAAPSCLTAVFLNGKVLLSWWGSAYATSYVVQRGTASGGPYNTTLASGITDPRSYEDSSMSAGTYYYIVRANSTSGPASSQVSITTGNPLIAYYKFDETSGTSASDSSGNGYTATLSGSTSFVSGRINNGVKLDGSSGYVSLPTTLLNQLGDFTIAAWVYVSTQYWIGRYQYSGDAYLNGIVDDFRIYAGCLSASLVQSLVSMSG
uniref:Fibronectin type-III domain-containing protein n=1 Tax=Acrobeloides nanus TaxID=290746 RepID=A0A914DUP2_9BILA